MFSRSIHHLYLNTIGDVELSLDGGLVFMKLQADALNTFHNIHQKRVDFQGSGAVSGYGSAV